MHPKGGPENASEDQSPARSCSAPVEAVLPLVPPRVLPLHLPLRVFPYFPALTHAHAHTFSQASKNTHLINTQLKAHKHAHTHVCLYASLRRPGRPFMEYRS